MAYRRRQGISRASTFKEEFHSSLDNNDNVKDSSVHHEKNASAPPFLSSSSFSSSSTLAAQAIKASAAARREPSLSFAFTPFSDADHQRSKNFPSQFKPLYEPPDSNKMMENPTFRKGLDRITTSLNQLGDTFEKAFEEGRTMVESKTADLRTQIRRKGNVPEDTNLASEVRNPWQQSDQTQNPSRQETQLKASRDVAMATAAKAKLLLRELKTVKADLAFAKARCAQLEEENKLLRDREGSEKGQNREDDDLIRLQLETLLAEKARLANENETYSRENRFLREVVEYHQLTMQDVVYLDEGMEEVTEVSNGVHQLLSVSSHSSSPPSPDEVVLASTSPRMLTKGMFPVPEEDDDDDDDDKSTSEDEATHHTSVSKHAK